VCRLRQAVDRWASQSPSALCVQVMCAVGGDSCGMKPPLRRSGQLVAAPSAIQTLSGKSRVPCRPFDTLRVRCRRGSEEDWMECRAIPGLGTVGNSSVQS